MCSCAEIIYTKNLNYKGTFIKSAKGDLRAMSPDDAWKAILSINPNLDLWYKEAILDKFPAKLVQGKSFLFNADIYFVAMDHFLSIYDIMVDCFKRVDKEAKE